MAKSSVNADALNSSAASEAESVLQPTNPKRQGFQLLFGLANTVPGVCNLTIYAVLLPAQIALLDPVNKINTLALITAMGAIAAVIINPLTGALSDRTSSRLGRRRPWIISGSALVLVALILLANSSSIAQLAAVAVLLQIGVNIQLAGLSAIIPDQVPLSQRATVSAFAGMAPLVGGVIGLILITQVAKGMQAAYYLLAGASSVLIVLFLCVLREVHVPRENVPPLRFKEMEASFWVNPIKHTDFGYTLLARGLIFLSYTCLVAYLLYFLQDVVHYQNLFPGQTAVQGVQIFQTASTASIILAAIVGGVISDKVQRRKLFVVGAGVVMAGALLLLAFFPAWSVVLTASCILGLGFGTYLSVDLALATQILPVASNRGKDLGIINTAIFIPQLLTPAVAALAIGTFHSYTALFLIAAISALLASGLILPIKGGHSRNSLSRQKRYRKCEEQL